MIEKLFNGVPAEVTLQIRQFMYAFNGVLAGSFVARYFYPDWIPGDIDIFIPTDRSDGAPSFFEATQRFGWDRYYLDYTFEPEAGTCAVEVEYYTVQGVIINIIRYTSENKPALIRDIQQNFDFNGCACVFDGQTIQMHPSMSLDDLHNKRWKITHPRASDVLCEKVCHKLISRLEKYEKRGVSFVNVSDLVKSGYFGQFTKFVNP